MLAIASLALALATIPLNLISALVGVPLGLLGCIPAVICGHMALNQIRGSARLRGAGVAKAGLIVGYIFVLIGVVALAFYVYALATGKPLLSKGSRGRKDAWPTYVPTKPRSSGSRQSSSGSSGVVPPSSTPVPRPLSPDPAVTTDPKTVQIPSAVLSGKLCGVPFQPSAANLRGRTLTIIHGKPPVGDADVKIMFLKPDVASLAGQTFTVAPGKKDDGIMAVHYRQWQGTGGNRGGVARNHALRVEFGAAGEKTIPVKLYLELPSGEDTLLTGSFFAELK